MTATPPFPELLALIDSRSAALRDAVAAAPDLVATVPGCPEWTLRDLVTHTGKVQRFWAAAVTAADDSGPPTAEQLGDREPPSMSPGGDDPAGAGPTGGDGPSRAGLAGGAAAGATRGGHERHDVLLDWFAASTESLLTALRAAGPDTPCWAWWESSVAPLTAGTVARHQVQEAAVHAYDAQETIGSPEPIPAAAAVDGVSEFLTVCLGSRTPWPHRPARVAFQAIEGPSWTLDLSPSGATVGPAASGDPVTRLQGRASDLVLALYRRIPLADVRVDGDREVAGQLREWCRID
ncbi:maleylpyruvate isomerase family mycothiol-dependent enzyme [Actinoplanes sp. NBRC 101535]|uniref:maleylpyruvate isomerase family mycothiol-dependent enzyme n=1 Tax=Actinoplanes sp. NBRC 101535 TaxID=3032196 RepID=UPI0024A2EA6E|nr:maleylpyruvate isomerase family mycothiol-dependent enzyme [Actinoplanes sp. NBRC 101535]GLY02031.1 hypothetical protein Acsp01_24100 [Actinoplanes sp. NBRC 101535]